VILDTIVTTMVDQAEPTTGRCSGYAGPGAEVLMRAGSVGRVRMLCCVSSSLIPLIARHREVVCVVEFVAP
jgi:hypothetical protein